MQEVIVYLKCRQAQEKLSRSCPLSWHTSIIIRSIGNSYIAHVSTHFEPLFCCLTIIGTMSEIEKALSELKALMKYPTEQLGYEEDFRGLGLTSRKNLCLHPS